MNDIINDLYNVILSRKNDPVEGSYTNYLFDKGLDKILKKVGEECAETLIAAKNGENNELCNEICDLLYHLLVLTAQSGLPIEDIEKEMEKRSEKIGNLKVMKNTDKNT